MADTSDRRDAMQRIRIGLTGLAGVLVLVLLAAAVLGLRSSDQAALSAGGAHVAPHAASAPKDPLAELGVTPGGGAEPPPPPSAPAARPTAPAHAAHPADAARAAMSRARAR